MANATQGAPNVGQAPIPAMGPPKQAQVGADFAGLAAIAQKAGTQVGEEAFRLTNEQLQAARGIDPNKGMPKQDQRVRPLSNERFMARIRRSIAAGEWKPDPENPEAVPEGLEVEHYVCTFEPNLIMTVIEGRTGTATRPGRESTSIRFGDKSLHFPETHYYTPDFHELVAEEHSRIVDSGEAAREGVDEMSLARTRAAMKILLIKEHLSKEGLAAYHPAKAGIVMKVKPVDQVQREADQAKMKAGFEAMKTATAEELAEAGVDIRAIIANLEKQQGPERKPKLIRQDIPKRE